MTIKGIRLLGYQKIEGRIKCETGLRIGCGGETIEIGGLENSVIKHPITREPYIPGSSLKGKMRSLLELKLNMIEPDGDVHKYNAAKCQLNCPICRIFGAAGGAGSPFGPGRLIVRDAKRVKPEGQSDDQEDLTQTEIKWENVINRLTGTTANLRPMERVPAGAEFSFEMDYRIFNVVTEDNKEDNGEVDKKLFGYVLQGLKLIQMDTLGGSGSRGYGKVKFENVKVTRLDGTTTSIDIDKIPLQEIIL